MDILNFISWIKGGRVVTTVDPTQTLLPVGLKDSRRDDGYLAGAISVEDFANQVGGLQTVAVDGVTITGDGTPGDPLVAAGGSSYTVYSAIITQNGAGNAPIATVLENTIGITPSFAYNAVGQYSIEFPGLFPYAQGNEQVLTFFTTRTSNNVTYLGQAFPPTSYINIQTRALFTDGPFTANQLTDGLLNGSIEIRVYP